MRILKIACELHAQTMRIFHVVSMRITYTYCDAIVLLLIRFQCTFNASHTSAYYANHIGTYLRKPATKLHIYSYVHVVCL